jgi:hypothetical protein
VCLLAGKYWRQKRMEIDVVVLFDGSVNCSQCLNKNSGHVFDFWTGNGARKVKPTVWMERYGKKRKL